ncbi:MAG: hypothetical protein JWR61_1970 [Ferruginibacter sp.]|uniref:hypothetical protein n=1 Tax=Ferruginibacter sp. TaxID=1940288 RepID=UPI002659F5B2|nr:hypothetical protein [Ferruginibacter sp.]MDB5277015.1 hypothetical protein [Ferruginibacter sp.]
MKQIITLLIAIVISHSSFATLKPVKLVSASKAVISFKSSNALKVTLKNAGKISLGWNAGYETTGTSYLIEKSINGGEFKTVAILMGESNDAYHFSDNIKTTSGVVNYRIVTMDNSSAINALGQNVVIF